MNDQDSLSMWAAHAALCNHCAQVYFAQPATWNLTCAQGASLFLNALATRERQKRAEAQNQNTPTPAPKSL
jgi:hypothetical protein